MYSHEDRMRAVELCIRYGHSAADVTRGLGYPDRGSLRNRFGESEESGDPHAGKAPCSWKHEPLGRKAPCAMPGSDVETEGANALAARVAGPEGRVGEPELRKAMLEGTVALLGKDPGADPNRSTDGGKAPPTGPLGPSWPLKDPPAGVGLGKPGRCCQVGAIAAGGRDAGLRERVRAAFDAGDGSYGRGRVHGEPAAGGSPAGGRRIAGTMREERLAARGCKRRRGYGSCKGETSRHPGNKAGRDFRAGPPDFLRLTDVTRFAIPAGKVHLGPVPDRFDGATASRAAPTGPSAETADSMPRGALETAPDGQRRFLVLHPDCGCHHRWPEWISICEEAGITRSMPAKGRGPDNSATGGFLGRMKTRCSTGGTGAGSRSRSSSTASASTSSATIPNASSARWVG